MLLFKLPVLLLLKGPWLAFKATKFLVEHHPLGLLASRKSAVLALLLFIMNLLAMAHSAPSVADEHRSEILKAGHDPGILTLPEAVNLFDIKDPSLRELEMAKLEVILRGRKTASGENQTGENFISPSYDNHGLEPGTVTSILVYDCLDRRTSHTPIDLHTSEMCEVQETNYRDPVNLTIQVMQSGGSTTIEGFSCLFTLSTTIHRCGFDHLRKAPFDTAYYT